MIETRMLTKRFGKVLAVNQLDLAVEQGELCGFIGPNGAGKTTTIQILATLLRPTGGSASIAGLDVASYGREVRRRVGYMPDLFGTYENLRVREYLDFFAAAYDVARARRRRVVTEVLELTDLASKRDTLVGQLSRGMQQRLSLARVLIHDPDVLLLDEPASGLDPRARVEVREILRELRRMGKTILLSSHILTDVAEVCTSIGVIDRGRLVASGSLGEVLARAGAGKLVRARVEGSLDGAATALEELAGVQHVHVSDEGEIQIRFADGQREVPDVAAVLVARGLRIRGLDYESVGIEEAYLRLVSGPES
jgi:ABC-2 type transport system ATP-binding protein